MTTISHLFLLDDLDTFVTAIQRIAPCGCSWTEVHDADPDYPDDDITGVTFCADHGGK